LGLSKIEVYLEGQRFQDIEEIHKNVTAALSDIPKEVLINIFSSGSIAGQNVYPHKQAVLKARIQEYLQHTLSMIL
jgi:hypothetical protein